MKHIKSSLFVLAVGLCIISCNNSKTEETQNTDSTNMTAPTPTNTMPADTTTAPTTDTSMNNNSSGASGSNTGSSSMNENSSSSNNGSIHTSSSNVSATNINNTTPMHALPTAPISRRTVKHVDTRSAVAKTGEYNSDVRTPNPPNLDDRRLKNHPPAHTYGDTANLHNGAVESVR